MRLLKELEMASKPWNCYNKGCVDENGNRTSLGTVVNGELQLNKDFAQANTDGASLVVVCPNCGRPNVWWPKDSDLVEATLRTHAFSALLRELARGQIEMVFETMAGRDLANEIAEALVEKLTEAQG
jgi:hypothetical protein